MLLHERRYARRAPDGAISSTTAFQCGGDCSDDAGDGKIEEELALEWHHLVDIADSPVDQAIVDNHSAHSYRFALQT